MSAKTINYKDLSPAQRRKGAAEARQRIMAMLSNPFLPADQRAAFDAHLVKLEHWERGTLDKLIPVVRPTPVPTLTAPKTPAALPAGKAHEVSVVETLSVVEKK